MQYITRSYKYCTVYVLNLDLYLQLLLKRLHALFLHCFYLWARPLSYLGWLCLLSAIIKESYISQRLLAIENNWYHAARASQSGMIETLKARKWKVFFSFNFDKTWWFWLTPCNGNYGIQYGCYLVILSFCFSVFSSFEKCFWSDVRDTWNEGGVFLWFANVTTHCPPLMYMDFRYWHSTWLIRIRVHTS